MSHLSVQTKLDSSFKTALLRSKTSTSSESSINEYMYRPFMFLNKGSTVIYFYLFSSALLTSLNFPCICVLSFSVFCFTNLDYHLVQMPPPDCSRLLNVYCIPDLFSYIYWYGNNITWSWYNGYEIKYRNQLNLSKFHKILFQAASASALYMLLLATFWTIKEDLYPALSE
jgi:hypothetical protein